MFKVENIENFVDYFHPSINLKSGEKYKIPYNYSSVSDTFVTVQNENGFIEFIPCNVNCFFFTDIDDNDSITFYVNDLPENESVMVHWMGTDEYCTDANTPLYNLRLPITFSQKRDADEFDSYFQISNNQSRKGKTLTKTYYVYDVLGDSQTFDIIKSIFASQKVYIDGQRMVLVEPIDRGERLGRSNLFKAQITLDPFDEFITLDEPIACTDLTKAYITIDYVQDINLNNGTIQKHYDLKLFNRQVGSTYELKQLITNIDEQAVIEVVPTDLTNIQIGGTILSIDNMDTTNIPVNTLFPLNVDYFDYTQDVFDSNFEFLDTSKKGSLKTFELYEDGILIQTIFLNNEIALTSLLAITTNNLKVKNVILAKAYDLITIETLSQYDVLEIRDTFGDLVVTETISGNSLILGSIVPEEYALTAVKNTTYYNHNSNYLGLILVDIVLAFSETEESVFIDKFGNFTNVTLELQESINNGAYTTIADAKTITSYTPNYTAGSTYKYRLKCTYTYNAQSQSVYSNEITHIEPDTGASDVTVTGGTNVSPSLQSVSGTIVVANAPTTITLHVFGGTSTGSNTTGFLDTSGGNISAYANQFQTSTATLVLPVGSYTYTLGGIFNGSSGNSAYFTWT